MVYCGDVPEVNRIGTVVGDRFRIDELIGRGAMAEVYRALDQDTQAYVALKILRHTHVNDAVSLARFAREADVQVRFIEYMPLDAQHEWERAKVVPGARILDAIDAAFPLAARHHATEPATTYGFADGAPGSIGVIASVTEPFCDTCNRLRLTAEGQFRTCLFALDETDLRGPLRAGASDADLEGLIRSAVAAKWSGHRINHPDFVQPARSMSAIGG